MHSQDTQASKDKETQNAQLDLMSSEHSHQLAELQKEVELAQVRAVASGDERIKLLQRDLKSAQELIASSASDIVALENAKAQELDAVANDFTSQVVSVQTELDACQQAGLTRGKEADKEREQLASQLELLSSEYSRQRQELDVALIQGAQDAETRVESLQSELKFAREAITRYACEAKVAQEAAAASLEDQSAQHARHVASLDCELSIARDDAGRVGPLHEKLAAAEQAAAAESELMRTELAMLQSELTSAVADAEPPVLPAVAMNGSSSHDKEESFHALENHVEELTNELAVSRRERDVARSHEQQLAAVIASDANARHGSIEATRLMESRVEELAAELVTTRRERSDAAHSEQRLASALSSSSSRVRELENENARLQDTSSQLQDVASRTADRAQTQAYRQRELEDRLANLSNNPVVKAAVVTSSVVGTVSSAAIKCLRSRGGYEPASTHSDGDGIGDRHPNVVGATLEL